MKVRSIVISLSFLLQFSPLTANAATIQIPQTGQISCYDADGVSVACSDPAVYGQDGQKRAGVAWPDPRFTDNANGTVTDNLTGLVWLKKADCFGVLDWQTALENANGLASGACDLTDSSVKGDWRLPNVVELESLLDPGNSMPSIPASNPFLSVRKDFYWTSSTYVDDTSASWIIDIGDAFKGSYGYKNDQIYLWPVRNAIASDIPHPEPIVKLPVSGQTDCYDNTDVVVDCSDPTVYGQDGQKLSGAVWPVQRFADNLDGTVTDNLTGLVWLRDAYCVDLLTQNWTGALTTVNNLKGDNSICALNDGSRLNDWRLPNRKELLSLIDYQYSSPALTPSNPFLNVPGELDDSYYWTSNSVDYEHGKAWLVDLYDGYAMTEAKTINLRIWPVRDVIVLPNSDPLITEGDTASATMSKNGIPTVFNLSLHATDADNDQLSWSVAVAAASGSAAAAGSGTGANISYTPNSGFVGQDSFTVKVSDGKGGADSIIVNVTVNQTFIVHPLVSGNGSIFPATEQILNNGSSTTLNVNAGADSYVAGVTGCGGTLLGNSYLTGAVTDNCFVFADFKITQVKVPGNMTRTDFNTLQEAYGSLTTLDGMTLQARGTTFVGDFMMDRQIKINLTGGYDSNFQPTADFSTVQGTVSIAGGSLAVDKLIIK